MKRITKIEENMLLEKRKLRVAAYCRVSTARDEQLVSLAAQKAHYENYIKSNDEGSILKTPLDTPLLIFRNGHRLAFCQTA